MKFAANIGKAIVCGSIVFALASVTGCGNSAYKGGSKTVQSIENVRSELQQATDMIDVTVASLDELITKPHGDLKTQFNQFSKNVDNLDAQAEKIRKRVDEMDRRGDEYFTEWETQLRAIESEEIKAQSQARWQKVKESFNEVDMKLESVRDAFQPFFRDVKDIRTALNMDLNVNGLQAQKANLDKVKATADDVQQKIQSVVDELDEIYRALSPSTVTETKASGGSM